MRVLVLDIGGSHVKVFAPGRKEPVEIESGRHMTPRRMLAEVRKAINGLGFDVVTIGYPGLIRENLIKQDAPNLGKGWVGFDFHKALKHPVRILNDAAMQALGSYKGGRMLFLGLGTGLGSAVILDGVLHAMELGSLPYRNGRSYADYLGKVVLKRIGVTAWSRDVLACLKQLKGAFQVDYIVLGGGQAKLIKKLPAGVIRGDNSKAYDGGLRVWQPVYGRWLNSRSKER